MLDHLRRIVVEGPVGSGKTSLAQRLARTLQAQELPDSARRSPFLEPFYRDPARHALALQLWCLTQRAVQLQQWQAGVLAGQRMVTNFLMAKDRLHAALTLSDDELALYDAIAARLDLPPQRADLVIVLQAPRRSCASASCAAASLARPASTNTTCSAWPAPTANCSTGTTTPRCWSSTPPTSIRWTMMTISVHYCRASKICAAARPFSISLRPDRLRLPDTTQ